MFIFSLSCSFSFLKFSRPKLEILTLLSQFDKEEIQQIMIIMTYWDEMIKDGIVNNDDINNLSMLSKEKKEE